MPPPRKPNQGFTVAEVLITLGIIGIVSAITIPALIADYQKKVTVNKLKIAYSILSQAIELSKRENGEPSFWSDALTSDEYNQQYFIPYLKIVKTGQNDHKFIARSNNSWKPEYYFADNSFVQAPILYLSNGMIVKIVISNNYNFNGNRIIVDINGKAKPNIMGRDIFVFFIPKTYRESGFGYSIHNGDIKKQNGVGKLVPLGYSWDRETLKGNCASAESSRYAGDVCASLIMTDNWQIKDDYPW